MIGGTFLLEAALETGLSPLAGRLSDRHGALMPIQLSLIAAVLVSLLAPTARPAAVLIVVLVIGMPGFGTMFAPATALLSGGADRLGLSQGLAFGLGNLAWASGQAVAAAASGAIAQATSDLVPYLLLAAICLATLIAIRPTGRRLAASAWRAVRGARGSGTLKPSATRPLNPPTANRPPTPPPRRGRHPPCEAGTRLSRPHPPRWRPTRLSDPTAPPPLIMGSLTSRSPLIPQPPHLKRPRRVGARPPREQDVTGERGGWGGGRVQL